MTSKFQLKLTAIFLCIAFETYLVFQLFSNALLVLDNLQLQNFSMKSFERIGKMSHFNKSNDMNVSIEGGISVLRYLEPLLN